MFDNISHPRQRAFLAAYSECGNVLASAKIADVCRELHYDWKAQDAVYAAAFAHAEQLAGDALEDRARELATAETNPCIKTLHFLLKGLKPEKYGTKRVEQSGVIEHAHSHAVDLSALSEDDLDKLDQLLARAAKSASDRGRTVAAEALPDRTALPG